MCCALAAFKGIHQCTYNKTAASWGMGGPPPFSPSLFSKKKAIRHLRHHYDYICDDVMFRLLRNNIPMDFFPQGDTPWYVRTGLQASAGDWKQLQCMDAAVMLEMLASAPEIVASSQAGSHQHCLHPTGSLRSAINYNCDPYQYITGLWKPQLACPILRISAVSKNAKGVCLYHLST